MTTPATGVMGMNSWTTVTVAMQPTFRVSVHSRSVSGGAAYVTRMSLPWRPNDTPALMAHPRNVQLGSVRDSTGRLAWQRHGPVSGSSWLTAATRLPWRAAAVRVLYS